MSERDRPTLPPSPLPKHLCISYVIFVPHGLWPKQEFTVGFAADYTTETQYLPKRTHCCNLCSLYLKMASYLFTGVPGVELDKVNGDLSLLKECLNSRKHCTGGSGIPM